MSRVVYVDCNRQNSVRSENTNEWEYKLSDEALYLPKGTEISIQESFVNKKGISGGSIEINEPIDETIDISYYVSESLMPVAAPENAGKTPDLYDNMLWGQTHAYPSTLPVEACFKKETITEGGVEYKNVVSLEPDKWRWKSRYGRFPNINTGATFHANFDTGVSPAPLNNISVNRTYTKLVEDNVCYGLSEIPKPVMVLEDRQFRNLPTDPLTTEKTFIPKTNSVRIFIPAKVYSLGELAELISDQMTGRKLASEVEKGNTYTNFLTEQINTNTFTGLFDPNAVLTTGKALNNNPMFRQVKAGEAAPLTGKVASVPFNFFDPTNDATTNYLRCNNATYEPNVVNDVDFFASGLAFNDYVSNRKFKTTEELYFSNWIYRRTLQFGRPPGNHPDTAAEQYRGFVERTVNNGLGAYTEYFPVFTEDTLALSFRFNPFYTAFSSQSNSYGVNTLEQGYYIGAPEFTFEFSNTESSFTINRLHNPYRIPSVDIYNNDLTNSGEECVFLRQPQDNATTLDRSATQVATQSVNLSNQDGLGDIINNFKKPMERQGGCAIFNWAKNVAQKLGDNPIWVKNLYSSDGLKLWTFRDYFANDKSARNAWETTLWSRLGFTYDQLANPDNYEKYKVWDNDTLATIHGTTTRPDLDISAVGSISGNYPCVSVGEFTQPTKYFGTEGTNAPNDAFNENFLEEGIPFGKGAYESGADPSVIKTAIAHGNNANTYYGSFFTKSATIPLITSGRPIVARNLPTLTEDGYFLVHSDIASTGEDYVKNTDNLSIVGVVPLSNLASQDFINMRNDMIHVLNQDKILNSVKIRILTPKLKNPILDDFSSILLKLIIPMPNVAPSIPLLPAQQQQGGVPNKESEQEKLKKDNQ